jgi:hypothetical protein
VTLLGGPRSPICCTLLGTQRIDQPRFGPASTPEAGISANSLTGTTDVSTL